MAQTITKALPSAPKEELGSQLEFDEFIRSHRKEVSAMVDKLTRGLITPDEFGDGMYRLMRDGHEGAWRRGRWRAGDKTNATADDLLIGRGKADEQSEFLRGFVRDIESDDWGKNPDGSWRSERIRSRANLYVGAYRGTANEAFVEACDDDEEFDWVLGGVENHCDECPKLARLSPWDKSTLFTKPGEGDTPCLGNCKCVLVRHSDGLSGFKRAGSAPAESTVELESDGFPSDSMIEHHMTSFSGGVNISYVADTPLGKFYVKEFVSTYEGAAGELAAKEIADVVGCGKMVPECTTRIINGEECFVQRFFSGTEFSSCARPYERIATVSHRDRQRMFIFDFVIGNTDRHAGNFLLDGKKLGLIDHERAFQRGVFLVRRALWDFDLEGNTEVEKRKFKLERSIIRQFTERADEIETICKRFHLDWASVRGRLDVLVTLLAQRGLTVGKLLDLV